MRISVQERVQVSVLKPAQELAVLEREQAWRRWAQAVASIREYLPVAQRPDSGLQLPEVSKAPLDSAT